MVSLTVQADLELTTQLELTFNRDSPALGIRHLLLYLMY